MRSMTCYACKTVTSEDVTIMVEIKSYNSRYLDVSVYIPSWLSPLEIRVREYLSSRFSRGKLEVSIKVRENDLQMSVIVNNNTASEYYKAIMGLAETLSIKEKPGIADILGLEGVLVTETVRDAEKYWSLIKPVLAETINQAENDRIREGAHTGEDILAHISILEDSVKSIINYVPELENTIKENLRSRFSELLGSKIDESRVLAETAVLLMKYTISEEISRLNSHLKEFRLEAEKNPSPGKKLDFLSQEINREINTIGSKTPMLEVSRAVVEMKNALENIREQLRNVE